MPFQNLYSTGARVYNNYNYVQPDPLNFVYMYLNQIYCAQHMPHIASQKITGKAVRYAVYLNLHLDKLGIYEKLVVKICNAALCQCKIPGHLKKNGRTGEGKKLQTSQCRVQYSYPTPPP